MEKGKGNPFELGSKKAGLPVQQWRSVSSRVAEGEEGLREGV